MRIYDTDQTTLLLSQHVNLKLGYSYAFSAANYPTASPWTSAYSITSVQASEQLPGWQGSNLVDRDLGTIYSSLAFHSSKNDRGAWVAAWMDFNKGPQNISKIILQARMLGPSQPISFPASYDVSVTAPDNSAWIDLGNFKVQPNGTTGTATVQLPKSYSTYGVRITPSMLTTDESNQNYYFQLGEIALAP